jgi:hypothetical protein
MLPVNAAAGLVGRKQGGNTVLAQIVRFTPKAGQWNTLHNHMTTFTNQLKTTQNTTKHHHVLRNHNNNTCTVVVLFENKSDLDAFTGRHDAQQLLETFKQHSDGDVELFEAELTLSSV